MPMVEYPATGSGWIAAPSAARYARYSGVHHPDHCHSRRGVRGAEESSVARPHTPGGAGREADGRASGDRDVVVEADVLDRVEQGDALRPEMSPIPPARLLTTAVCTASARSVAPLLSPPELMNGLRPMKQLASW